MLINGQNDFTDKELMERGSKALIDELGYSNFLRFIRYSEGINKENYLNLEDRIFEDMPVDDMFDRAKRYWKKED